MDARGPAIDVAIYGGGHCRTCRHHPQGARHRRRQLQWWLLPDLPAVPSRGPAIDVSNSGVGRCRTCWQQPPGGPPSTSPTPVVAALGPAGSTPQGAHHRRRQLWWWPLPDLPAAPPQGASTDVANSGGGPCRNFFGNTYQGGHRGKQYHYKQGKMEARVSPKKIGSLRCQEPGSRNTITEKSKSTDSVTTVSLIRITKKGRKA
jgi:hypothetical protein